jgi:hypothetical protein
MFVWNLCQNAAEPFFGSNVFAQKLSAAIFLAKNQSPKRARTSSELRQCGNEI